VWSRIRAKADDGEIVREIQGLRLHLNPADRGLSMELAVEGVHEPLLTHLWRNLVESGMTVVDVGANLGYFALIAAQRVGPRGKVIAFEPAPASRGLLQRNVLENRVENVQISDLAIGDRSGGGRLQLFGHANWNSLVAREGALDAVEVRVETLDRALEREGRVDVVRMDVEGYETRVLLGMTDLLRRCRPTIVMELHASFMPPHELGELVECLDAATYRVRWAYPRKWDEVLWRGIPHPTRASRLDAEGDGDIRTLAGLRENFSVCVVPSSAP
jgi:FkbM family methyltransferase